jgi:hypothetical protein
VATLYVNGQVIGTRNDITGDFSNWDAGYFLGLANEVGGGRTWLGEYYRVAIYDRALMPGEINTNYLAGLGVTDQAGNPFAGDSVGFFIIDNTPPEIIRVSRLDPDPTRNLQVNFEVEFSEDVVNVDITDFVTTEVGAINGSSITGITILTSTTVQLQVDTGNLDGLLGVAASGATDITDVATNPLGNAAPVPNEVYEVDKNDAPTDIALVPTDVNENVPVGTTVGVLSTTDPDTSDTHTYTFTGPFFDAGGAFVIVGNEIRTAVPLDFETLNMYQISIRSTDDGLDTVPPTGLANLFIEEDFTITVNDVNEAPTSIALAPSSVPENSLNGTIVGTLSTADPDTSDTFTYTLIDDAGGRFAIVGDQVVVANGALLNFEVNPFHVIEVISTDNGPVPPFNLSTIELIQIDIIDVNEPPTNIFLNPSSVPENSPTNTIVGVLTPEDEDTTGIYTYQFVGPLFGGGQFNIVNDTVLVGAFPSLDFEATPSIDVNVRVTDNGPLLPNPFTFETTITITLIDVNEAPVAVCQDITRIADPNVCVVTVMPSEIDNGSFDVDAGDSFTLALDPPGPYDVGVNLVELIATDSGGLTGSCFANITVLDITPPTLTCPNDFTVQADQPGGANVNFPVFTDDNCSVPVLSFAPFAPGDFFPIGSSATVITSTDASGNQTSCTVTITVTDTPPGPTMNDLCNDAIVIGSTPYLSIMNTAGNANSLDDPLTPTIAIDGIPGGASPDMFFRITPTVTTAYRFFAQFTDLDLLPNITIYNGPCPLTDNDVLPEGMLLPDLLIDPSTARGQITLAGGNEYIFMLQGFSLGDRGGLAFYLDAITPPINNTCQGADEIVLTGTSVFAATVDTTDATNTIFHSENSPTTQPLVDLGGQDVWYRITPANDGTYLFEVEADFDHTIAVYTGGCNGVIEEVAYVDDVSSVPGIERLEVDLMGGIQYFVVIDGFAASASGLATIRAFGPAATVDNWSEY